MLKLFIYSKSPTSAPVVIYNRYEGNPSEYANQTYKPEKTENAAISGKIFKRLFFIKNFNTPEALKRTPLAAPKATQAKSTKI